MRSINESMQAHKIEGRLQTRVRRFYEFQWLHQRGVKNEFIRELPEALRSDIAVSQYATTLQRVPSNVMLDLLLPPPGMPPPPPPRRRRPRETQTWL